MSDSPFADIKIGQITSRWAQGTKLPCHYAPSMESTNDLAKAEAFDEAAEEALKVYLADHQTKGRGRGQNSWIDLEPGSSLLSSWSFALQDPPQPTLTPRLGLALVRALSSTWPFVNFVLKAPNDILVDGKKIAGLLAEVVSQGLDVRLVVGLGLNVWSSPQQSVSTSTHLTAELPENIPLLGEDWIGFLERWTFELSDGAARATEELSTTERRALQDFMNRHKALKIPVDEVLADGGLIIAGKRKPWMEL